MFLKFILSLLPVVLLLAGCDNGNDSNDPFDPTADLTMINEAYASGTLIKVYADKQAEVGYNRYYVTLSDSLSGKSIDRALVVFKPMMDMGTMKHAAPVENPQGMQAEEGLFRGAVTYIMAGMWSMKVEFDDQNGRSGAVSFMSDVAATQHVKKVTGSDSLSYFITLVEPMAPKVGMNDFSICVNYKQNMMSFPEVTDVGVEIEPTMPSMGHGSPNNENPQHSGGAHYKGKVNFTMSGDWQVAVTLKRNGNILAQTAFDITL